MSNPQIKHANLDLTVKDGKMTEINGRYGGGGGAEIITG
jgi:hypothetical protein